MMSKRLLIHIVSAGIAVGASYAQDGSLSETPSSSETPAQEVVPVVAAVVVNEEDKNELAEKVKEIENDQGEEAVADVGGIKPADKGAIRNRPNARVMTLSIPAPRGQIVDRYGRIMAQNKVVWYPAIQFKQFEHDDKDKILAWGRERINKANEVFDIEWNPSDKVLWEHYRHRRWLAMPYTHVVSSEDKSKYTDKLIEGLILHPLYQRHYPESETAAHIIGYVGTKGQLETGPINYGDPIFPYTEGRTGLEKVFDEHLTGREGLKRLQYDSDGFKHPEEEVQRPSAGGTLVTTIDLLWQKRAERVLAKHSKRGAIVIVDIHTGEVLTLASRPSYDLNAFVPFITQKAFAEIRDHKDKPLFARAFQGEYPPASAFKPLVGLSGLHYGVIDKQTQLNCPAYFQVGEHKFWNWSKKAEGVMNVELAIARSNNPFFYQVGHSIGSARMTSMARRFGFGSVTGLPLVSEADGNMPDEEWMVRYHRRRFKRGDNYNNSIGQGVLLATPLQVAQGMAAIANGGALPKLQLVRQMQDVRGRVILQSKFGVRNTLGVSQEHIMTIKEGMKAVVNSGYGTAKGAKLSYSVLSGKTGTAQWGRPSLNQRLAWFAGFFPYDNPKFAFAVLYEGDPNEKVSGGRNAAPMVKAFFEPIKPEVKSLIAPPARAQIVVASNDKPVEAITVQPVDENGEVITQKVVVVGQSSASTETTPQKVEVVQAVEVVDQGDAPSTEVSDSEETPTAEDDVVTADVIREENGETVIEKVVVVEQAVPVLPEDPSKPVQPEADDVEEEDPTE